MAKNTKNLDTSTIMVEVSNKVQAIIDLMLSIDSQEDALQICQVINLENMVLYNLVMGAIPPIQS